MDIAESIHRILSREEIVTDLFYDIFLDRHPEVRDFFIGVNLNHQAAVLRMSLLLVEHHYRQATPGLQLYLRVLGHHHAERHVPESLYPKFRDCLLETLRRFHGTDWTDELQAQWHAAIDAATTVMLEGYSQPAVY